MKAAVCERYGPQEVVRITDVPTPVPLMSLAERQALEPVIDSVVPFTRIADAHRRVDSGHKVGSVVLAFGQD